MTNDESVILSCVCERSLWQQWEDEWKWKLNLISHFQIRFKAASARPSRRRRRLPHVSHVLFAPNVTSLPLWDQHTEPPPPIPTTPGGWAEGPLGSPPSHCPSGISRPRVNDRPARPGNWSPASKHSVRISQQEATQKHDKHTQGDPDQAFPGLLVSKAPHSSWYWDVWKHLMLGVTLGLRADVVGASRVGGNVACSLNHSTAAITTSSIHQGSLRTHQHRTGKNKENVLNHFFQFTHTSGPFEYVCRPSHREQSWSFLTLGPFSSSVTHNAQWRWRQPRPSLYCPTRGPPPQLLHAQGSYSAWLYLCVSLSIISSPLQYLWIVFYYTGK